MAETRDFLIGVLVGSAIGAAAALLYAPAPGTETRQMIKDKAGEAKEKTALMAEQAKEKTVLMAEQAKLKAGELKGSAQGRIGDIKGTAQSRIDEITSQAHSMVDRGRQLVEQQKEAVIGAVEAGRQAYREKQSELQQEVAEDTTAQPMSTGTSATITPA